nr:hypothetical protein [Corynebacterium lactis]
MIDTYLTEMRRKLREADIPTSQRRAIVREQESLLLELAEADCDLAAELGTAADYAQHVTDEVSSLPGFGGQEASWLGSLHRYLSNPLRALSAKGRSSLWNIDDPRVLQPHLLGFGWSVNWAAVAIRLGIIRPDDIDGDVIAHIPHRDLRMATLFPSVLAAAHGIALAVTWKSLPAQLPTPGALGQHQQDRYRARLLGPLAVSAASAALSAAQLPANSDREDALRVASLATLLCGVSPTKLISAVVHQEKARNSAALQVGVGIAAVGASAACLILPLRAGLKATWKQAGIM